MSNFKNMRTLEKLPDFHVSWLSTNFCVVSPFEVTSETVIINRVL